MSDPVLRRAPDTAEDEIANQIAVLGDLWNLVRAASGAAGNESGRLLALERVRRVLPSTIAHLQGALSEMTVGAR